MKPAIAAPGARPSSSLGARPSRPLWLPPAAASAVSAEHRFWPAGVRPGRPRSQGEAANSPSVPARTPLRSRSHGLAPSVPAMARRWRMRAASSRMTARQAVADTHASGSCMCRRRVRMAQSTVSTYSSQRLSAAVDTAAAPAGLMNKFPPTGVSAAAAGKSTPVVEIFPDSGGSAGRGAAAGAAGAVGLLGRGGPSGARSDSSSSPLAGEGTKPSGLEASARPTPPPPPADTMSA